MGRGEEEGEGRGIEAVRESTREREREKERAVGWSLLGPVSELHHEVEYCQHHEQVEECVAVTHCHMLIISAVQMPLTLLLLLICIHGNTMTNVTSNFKSCDQMSDECRIM